MATALEGFLKHECNDSLAAKLRAEIEAASGAGYDHFDFDLFDVEFFYGENRVTIRDVVLDQYSDVEMPLADFVAALPDVPPGERMPGRPRHATPMPPPE